MTEYIMDGSAGENTRIEPEGHYVPHKEIFTERSPRSPLITRSPALSAESPHSDSIDLPIEAVADTSIEELYNNVCEMQSSDHSPSRGSFLSYGEESRIDSELRFLAGGDYHEVEIKKDVVAEHIEGDTTSDEAKGSDEDLGDKNEIRPSLTEMKRRDLSQFDSEASRKANLRIKTFQGRPPKANETLKSLKTLCSLSLTKNDRSSALEGVRLQNGTEDHRDAGYLGPYLLKQARDVITSGDNYQKALELALRAMKSFEKRATSKPNLDLVMCLHVVAAIYCRLGQHTEAIPVLERSIEIPVMDLGQSHALAKFAGCMQLGDTYAMLGQIENSILCYTAGLEIQQQVMGEKDPRFGETCRYLAEAHVQAMQFDEAEKLCLMSLDIHKENGSSAFPQEAADRRLLGLIYESKGNHEDALEHYVLARVAMATNGQNVGVAAIDCSIGDAYLSLARYDEAIFAYQKALNVFKSNEGENHPSVASVFVRLADLSNKIGKFSDSKSYCENALRIYSKSVPGSSPEEIASSLVDISAIYESMNEPDQALQLLQRAIKIYGNAPGQQTTIAGIEAQMGVLYNILGSYSDSYDSLKSAISKFRATGEKKSALFGMTLNQMGIACVQLYSINEAADLFEEARSILEAECGPHHADTLGVYSNLAGIYDAMGRNDDAIQIMEYVVRIREENLGTANLGGEDERKRLAELLKDTGMVASGKSISLEPLLVNNSHTGIQDQITVS